ncbi:MAG: aminomethyl-transferring glycine dehydrogenase [Micavibrio sp.]|nr:aminomethyl-transferring glycine dehydrogenase [Micavibrio sp.]
MRYLPQTKKAHQEMLDAIGIGTVDELYKDVPQSALKTAKIDLPDHASELEVERHMSVMASKNHAATQGPFFLGAGSYYHHVPATVDYIIQRSEFLTAYTPYQPEIAQGTLQMIFEYQTMIAQLTGQDVANASLYDGATSLAEAALMAMRVTKKDRVLVANDLHPHYEQVLKTYVPHLEVEADHTSISDESLACVIIQSPSFTGKPEDYQKWRDFCDETDALLIVVINEIISLGLLPAPELADIVCGEAQSIGLPMSFGGPHLGFFASREKYLRQLPGRLCGETTDADGKRSFVLTLSTREQHIRREKATSNICTNQGLCALAFTVHMALLGEDGFKSLAKINHERACKLADSLSEIENVNVLNDHFFNEFVIKLPKPAKEVVKEMTKKGIIAGYALENSHHLLVTATEMTSDEDINNFCTVLEELIND